MLFMTVQARSAQSDVGVAIPPRSRSGKWFDRSFSLVAQGFALAVAGVLIWIAVEVGLDAIPAIREFGLHFWIGTAWDPVHDQYGALPMIYGTLVSSFLALLLAVPIGVGTAIFLSEDFLPSPIRTTLTFMVELLAAIPSVVYGLWGIFILIPFLRPIGNWLHQTFGWIPLFSTFYAGPGMFPAAIILTIMILPIITVISRDSLVSLPASLRQASVGMGATRWSTIFRVLVPAAFSGIVGGTMLALGRAMGETMAVTMLIGNSNDLNLSILTSANTIASLLANQFSEANGLQVAALMYAGLILFGLTLIVNMLAEVVIRQVKQY
jgi:phosphate transport system permease protein